ncbi:AAA family ATPase [Caldiplasma sukawensis]
MIIVTGMPGAGKDEFIKVARSMGFIDYHMGETVRKYASMNGISFIDSEIGKFANQERVKFGMDIWARRLSENLKEKKRIIIDGLRNLEELNYFKSLGNNVVLVAIYAEREERLRRILKRNREDDIKNQSELESRDNRELGWGMGNAISLADYMIVNDSTLEDFRINSKKLIEKIIENHPEV